MPPKKKKKTLENNERFVEMDEEELNKLRLELENPNTKKADAKNERTWLNYLKSKSQLEDDLEYWHWDEEKLNFWLSKFWFEARTVEGDRYRVSSLEHLHFGMKRLLQRKGHNYDITKDSSFSKSQEAFSDACKQLKQPGYGYVESYKEIKPKDLVKLYNSPDLDPENSPRSLQNKVQLDIRYYLCRRGNENFHQMTKDFFQICIDEDSKMSYVKKVKDEMTKNHKEADQEIITGFMPQILNDDGRPHKLCPVRSFYNYVNLLSPKSESFWQQPLKNKPKDETIPWYKPLQLGHNTMEKFLGRLSDKIGLSEHYTNHCIRVSGATNLTRCKYSSRQIMSITGHKSMDSLAIYQKVCQDEKISMGISLMFNLLKPQEALKIRESVAKQFEEEKSQKVQIQGNQIAELPAPPAVPLLQQNKFTPPLAPPEMQLVQQISKMPEGNQSNSQIVPYQQQVKVNNSDFIPDFDLMEIIADMESQSSGNNNIVLAESQIAASQVSRMSSTKIVAKKANSPRKTMPTFAGCTFGSIGTLNIHVHKN